MHLVLLDDSSGAITGLIVDLVFLAIAVFYIAALWRIFTKAGKPGWAAIIPIYNTIVLLNIAGRSGWWILLFLIPVVDVVAIIIVMNDLSKSFGRGIGTTLGLIFLGEIFIPILGYGRAQYVGPRGVPVPVGAYR